MGGNCSLGVVLDDLVSTCPQYPVVGELQNPFKLYDFPLVSLKSLLY
jgi:hypothetical protein